MFCIFRGNIWLEQTYTLQLCSQLQISFPLSLLSLECTEFPDLKCLGPYQTSGTESKICWIIKFYPRTQQGVANENPRAIAWVWKFHLCANYDYVCLWVQKKKLLSARKTPSHSICCQSSHQVPNSREENELCEKNLHLEFQCPRRSKQAHLTLFWKPWSLKALNIDHGYLTKRDMAFPTVGFYQQVGKSFSSLWTSQMMVEGN